MHRYLFRIKDEINPVILDSNWSTNQQSVLNIINEMGSQFTGIGEVDEFIQQFQEQIIKQLKNLIKVSNHNI